MEKHFALQESRGEMPDVSSLLVVVYQLFFPLLSLFSPFPLFSLLVLGTLWFFFFVFFAFTLLLCDCDKLQGNVQQSSRAISRH